MQAYIFRHGRVDAIGLAVIGGNKEFETAKRRVQVQSWAALSITKIKLAGIADKLLIILQFELLKQTGAVSAYRFGA